MAGIQPNEHRMAEITGGPFARVQGRDGQDCPVWKNPSVQEVANLISGLRHEPRRLRAMLTERDLHVWEGEHVLHGDFVRRTRVDGVRVRLAPNLVAVNEETVGVPSSFPWIFGQNGDLMDMDRRRELVERWLKSNSWLAKFYPHGFTMNWYM
jgi:hypothetical protein